MQVEEHYRTAIGALRDRQWELATKNLLAVVAQDPQFRDAANVLLRLEKTRPVGYWRGAFMYAVESAAWDHAETAASKLSQIDPALRDASDAAARLQELTATGWHVPTQITIPPLPASPTHTETLPDDEHQAWLEALAEAQEQAALQSPVLDPAITPRTMILPALPEQPEAPPVETAATDILAENATVEDAVMADAIQDSAVADGISDNPVLDDIVSDDSIADGTISEPADLQPMPEIFPAEGQDATTTRALKSAEYEDVRPQMSESHGPVYDTLATPRALKTSTFLVEGDDRPDEEWPEPAPLLPPIPGPTPIHKPEGDNGRTQAAPPSTLPPVTAELTRETRPQAADPFASGAPLEDPPGGLAGWWRRVRAQVIILLLVIVIILGVILLARVIRKGAAAGSASSRLPAAAIVSTEPGPTSSFVF
jgi:hypothetical protein